MPIAHVITVLRVRPDGWPSPCCIRAKHPTSLTFSVAVLVSLKIRCYPCENQIGLQMHVELRASNHLRGSCVLMVAACCLPISEVGKLLGWCSWTGQPLFHVQASSSSQKPTHGSTCPHLVNLPAFKQ